MLNVPEYIYIKKSIKGGKGLFANTVIDKNKTIGEYTGKILSCNTRVVSHYQFTVRKKGKCVYVIDGKYIFSDPEQAKTLTKE